MTSQAVAHRRLFVDDVRDAPENWEVARTYQDAITMLSTGNYVEVSLDHDLGCFMNGREYTGYDILLWLINRKQYQYGHVPAVIDIHTANPVASEKMLSMVERYWHND
jgi:hypothetical protein